LDGTGSPKKIKRCFEELEILLIGYSDVLKNILWKPDENLQYLNRKWELIETRRAYQFNNDPNAQEMEEVLHHTLFECDCNSLTIFRVSNCVGMQLYPNRKTY